MSSQLPPELAPALRARRRSLAAQATGRVLDLGGWSDHAEAYGDSTDVVSLEQLTDLVTAEGEFDTVVSMIRTPLVADIDHFLAGLVRRLAPNGQVLFLEPTVCGGRVGEILALGGRLVRPVSGLHLDRDLPVDIRRNGLFITDLQRFSVPSVSAPLRPFVEARARRPTPPQASADLDDHRIDGDLS